MPITAPQSTALQSTAASSQVGPPNGQREFAPRERTTGEYISQGRRRRRRLTQVIAVVILVVAALGPGRLLLENWAGAPTHAGEGEPPATQPAQGLDPELLRRFDSAAAEAASEGVDLTITSGWRSAEQQQQIVDDAVAKLGRAEAERVVLPPEASAHVAGLAIDVGPMAGAQWLEERETTYGLCRTYDNEWWHFELVGEIGAPCPQRWPDASHGWG